jgi:hypothetical protein
MGHTLSAFCSVEMTTSKFILTLTGLATLPIAALFMAMLHFFGSTPISWSSHEQPTVALSTMEAEYMVLAKTTCEVLWLCKLASELDLISDGLTSIYIDSQSAIHFATNPIFHAHSKHIDIGHHFVRKCIASNEVILTHCTSKDNLTNMLTKALPQPQFMLLRDQVISAA